MGRWTRWLLVGGTLFLLTVGSVACRRTDSLPWREDFSSPESGWDRYDDDYGGADYRDGQYVVWVWEERTTVWGNANRDFDDLDLEVTAWADAQGEAEVVEYGVLCRYQDADHFYYLGVSNDGVAFIRVVDGEDDFLHSLGPEAVQLSPAIRRGNEPNRLRVVCDGDRLALYVNGSLVVEGRDDRFRHGDIGLAAGSFAEVDAIVRFDDLEGRRP